MAALLLVIMVVIFLTVTPLRRVLVGPGAGELRVTAQQNARRAAALEDTMAAQYRQIEQLRAIITGDTEELEDAALDPSAPSLPEQPAASPEENAGPDGSRALRGESFSIGVLNAAPEQSPPPGSAAESYLASLRLPTLPPVRGVFSRGFNAAGGHFGLDLAVDEGTAVRSIGEGYVVFADWTHSGGYTVAVQHAGGYLSIYKHNQRLLKDLGDRVRNREAVALSGDTGEITSGPHLHVEIWRNGLAQNPASFLLLAQ